MQKAFDTVQGQVTPARVAESVPWSEVEKCVVMFECKSSGDTITLISDGALKGSFLPMAELQLQNICLIGRLQTTGEIA